MGRRLLDVWSGDTVLGPGGQKYFEMRDGVFVPAAKAVSGRSWLREYLANFNRRVVTIAGRRFAYPQPLEGGGNQGWEETLDSTTADGIQISNTVSETIICPDFNIPAYYMAVGRTLRIWAFGVNSNVVTTPGTLTMRVRWGGVAGTPILLQSAAQGMDTTAHTNALFYLLAYLTCRSVGSSGSIMSGGIFGQFNLLTTTAANLLPALLGSAGAPGASGNVVQTADTTTAKLLSVTGQFSVATSPTNLTCQQRVIEALD